MTANWTPTPVRPDGEYLTGASYQADRAQAAAADVPQVQDDYSADLTQMQTVADPAPSGTPSLATTLAGELERLRFTLLKIKQSLRGTVAQWYEPFTIDPATLPPGPTGPTGPAGAAGATGPAGPGVPVAGTTGQVLTKNSATDYDTGWQTPAGGSGVTFPITVAQGGTNGTTAAAARTNLDVFSKGEINDGIDLDNNAAISGKTAAGVAQPLIRRNTTDGVVVGDTVNAIDLATPATRATGDLTSLGDTYVGDAVVAADRFLEVRAPSAQTPISRLHKAGVRAWNTSIDASGNLITRDSYDLTGAARITIQPGGHVLIAGNLTVAGTITPSAALPSTCEGRLTTESGVPVSTADRTAQSTLYFTPFRGNRVALYSGSAWAVSTFTERSLALSGLTSGKPYDVFLYDNAGTLTLELLVWTNDTTRATALALQDGVYVKSGVPTRRYVGTIYTTSATTTEDSQAKRYVWSAAQRVPRAMARAETTASWTYSTDTLRQANAAAANQLDFVLGLAEEAVVADVFAIVASSSGSCSVGIGLDSTTVNSAQLIQGGNPGGAGPIAGMSAHYRGTPAVGRHTLVWLERANATATWHGTTANWKTGIIGTVFA